MSRIYIKRNWNYVGMALKYRVIIDGVEMSDLLANGQTLNFEVSSGEHHIAIKQRLNPKSNYTFTIQEGEELYFETGVSNIYWVMYGLIMFGVIILNIGFAVNAFFLIILGGIVTLGGGIWSINHLYVQKKLYYFRRVK